MGERVGGVTGGGGAGPVYPAALPGVLAVSSVGPGGEPDPQGAEQGPRTQPRLSAPGVSVTGPGPGGGGQFTGGGDAVAGAFVAGTAALVLSYHPGLSGEQIAHRLEATAYGAVPDAPDPGVGPGVVDPVRALSAVLPEEHASSPSGTRNASAAHAVPPLDPPTARDHALAVAGGAVAVTLLVAFLAVVLPRGRRRGWRAGTAADRPAGRPRRRTQPAWPRGRGPGAGRPSPCPALPSRRSPSSSRSGSSGVCTWTTPLRVISCARPGGSCLGLVSLNR